MGMFKEFREFALKGNVVDMAVGIIIGGAFGTIVQSMVKDVMMPPIGYVTGGVDFSDKKIVLQPAVPAVLEVKDASGTVIQQATKAIPEVSINWGAFINAVIAFVIVAFCLFMLVKAMNSAKRRFELELVPPPGPTKDQQLLTEIRDLLAQRQ